MQPNLLRSGLCSSIKLRNVESIPPRLLCSGCSHLLINSFQTPHGCRLCQNCFESELLPQTRRLCPCINSLDRLDRSRDEAELNDHLVSQASCLPDIATRSDVLKLEVHCPNAESGCLKQLTLKQLDSHLADECELQFGTCDLCSERIEQFKLNGSHRNLQCADCCSKFRAPCPCCGDSSRMLDRIEFAEHLTTCPERTSDCKYRQSIGCDTTRRMSQLGEHYSTGTDGHLELSVQHFQRAMEDKDAELSQIRQTVMDLQEIQRNFVETHQELLDALRKQGLEIKKMQQQLNNVLKAQSQTRVRRLSNALEENSFEEQDPQRPPRMQKRRNSVY